MDEYMCRLRCDDVLDTVEYLKKFFYKCKFERICWSRKCVCRCV